MFSSMATADTKTRAAPSATIRIKAAPILHNQSTSKSIAATQYMPQKQAIYSFKIWSAGSTGESAGQIDLLRSSARLTATPPLRANPG